jgi:hypothetical protein
MSDVITLPKPFSRTSARPVERESIFATFEALTAYAASPIAYGGHIVAVTGTNIPYIVNNNLTVQPIALQSFSDGKFLPLSGGFVTGNIVSNSSISANQINVDNIQLEGNTISITDSNGDLTLQPNGNGEVNISKVDIDAGTIDNVTIGGTAAAISISAALLNVDNIRVDGNTMSSTNTNGDINLTPNGNGTVNIPKVDIDSGTIDNITIGSTSAAISISSALLNVDNIRVDGNAITSTNVDGNIALTPNGDGEVDITKIDIDSGTIDNVTIGGTGAAISISAALLNVDNVRVDGNTISTTNTNGDLIVVANGTGDIQLSADTIKVGDINEPVTITSNGTGNLIINTNSGTNSGSLTFNQGTNGDITFALNGLGEVNIPRVDIDAGTIDNVTIGGTNAAISISAALLNVDNIRIDGNAITSTNSNGNIDLTPNGSGEVNISKVDIDLGTIDSTTIGLTTPASAAFTGVYVVGNVNIGGNLFVAGTATQVNTTDLIIKDPIIFLAEGNQGDVVDIGFTAAYNHNLVPPRHTGFIRDSADGKWTLFSNLSVEILSAVNIPLSDPSVQIDTLRANIEGTITGNVSGIAAQAVKFVTGRTISTTGDIIYTSGALDGTANVTGVATISSNVVDYSKIQKVSANKILGNPTGSIANVSEIDCTSAGRALLDDATAADQRNTLGVGAAQSVTFADVTVNNANNKSVLSKVYNGTSASNTLTLTTFPSATYFSAKYTVQIKRVDNNKRCALEIIATNNSGTWEGTVYGIVDPGSIFSNVDIGVASNSVYLEFTFIGAVSHEVIAYTQAFSN